MDGAMANFGKTLFSIQKYMILETKFNDQSEEPRISDADAYAWSVNLYPLFSKGAWHDPVKDFFDVSEEKVLGVIKYLDEEWSNRRCYFFNEIISNFPSMVIGFEIDKWDLIRILRYTYLCGNRFDDEFWNKVDQQGESPIEAKSIRKNFDINEIKKLCYTGN
jgi:hypothetical protein